MSKCDNIRHFSNSVFDFLSDTFSYGLTFSELGMTDHLVLNIARYKRDTSDSSVEIYKLPWTIESVFGNDLDLFIENSSGTFDWYSLQAKIMSDNGAFKDIKNPTDGSVSQWDKLGHHEILFGSKTFYLLYCGNPRINTINQRPTRRDCFGIPPLREYGLSIVETDVIKNLRENFLTPYGQLFFSNVFPKNTDAIRKLFCCNGNGAQSKKQFKLSEIKTDKYKKIYSEEDNNSNKNQNDDSYKPVITKSRDGESKYRIIIKNTIKKD